MDLASIKYHLLQISLKNCGNGLALAWRDSHFLEALARSDHPLKF